MDKYIFDESNDPWHECQGDYYIPCLNLPAEDEQPIGLWASGTCDTSKSTAKPSTPA